MSFNYDANKTHFHNKGTVGATGQRIPCFDNCQLITTLMCNMCVQYQSSCAPKLGRKCEDWTLVTLWCGRTGVRMDGRAGGRCTVMWLPNFLEWVDLLTHGALQAGFARLSSAIIQNCLKFHSPIGSCQISLQIMLLPVLIVWLKNWSIFYQVLHSY